MDRVDPQLHRHGEQNRRHDDDDGGQLHHIAGEQLKKITGIDNFDDIINCKDKTGAATGLPDFPVVVTEPAQQCSPVSYAIARKSHAGPLPPSQPLRKNVTACVASLGTPCR